MKTLTMYGASDDLVEADGIPGADEFDCYQPRPGEDIHASFVLGGRMRIRAIYDGCWSFAIGQVEEETPLPDWPIRISQHERGYSTLVEIDVPDDVSLIRERDPS
jgi:hypothetical protein